MQIHTPQNKYLRNNICTRLQSSEVCYVYRCVCVCTKYMCEFCVCVSVCVRVRVCVRVCTSSSQRSPKHLSIFVHKRQKGCVCLNVCVWNCHFLWLCSVAFRLI